MPGQGDVGLSSDMGDVLPKISLGTNLVAQGVGSAMHHNCAIIQGGDVKVHVPTLRAPSLASDEGIHLKTVCISSEAAKRSEKRQPSSEKSALPRFVAACSSVLNVVPNIESELTFHQP